MKFRRVCVCVISFLSYVAAQGVTEADTATDGASAVDTTDSEIIADEETAETSKTDQKEQEAQQRKQLEEDDLPIQSGPFIDLLGPTLLSLEMTSETTATLNEHLTNDALQGKKVIGLYFSADWCGPCRQVSVTSSTTWDYWFFWPHLKTKLGSDTDTFLLNCPLFHQFTPELVKFYEKVNKRRRNDFQIVWISRCRDVQSYGQYFTEMKWLALPPQEAMGERGQWLGDMYGVKSIPSLVLLDDVGNVITKDARNQIPKDKAGIGFPWRNPLSTLYITVVPKTFRHMIKSNVANLKNQVFQRIQTVFRPKQTTAWVRSKYSFGGIHTRTVEFTGPIEKSAISAQRNTTESRRYR